MPEPTSRRIPSLLHLVLFLSLTFLSLVAAQALALILAHPHPLSAGFFNQKLQLCANTLTYALALFAASFLFPPLWGTTFLRGLRWNASAARPLLILLGFLLGFLSQAASCFLPTPKRMPVEDAFQSPGLIWFLVCFGTVVAPLFEEIVFRGFLLPALASAVDWLRLPRSANPLESLQTLDCWRAAPSSSTVALAVSSLLTSAAFALLHALQLGFNWAPVLLLFVVSLFFCLVRIRTGSVAASTLVHATYNLSVFVSIFIGTSGFRHMDRV